MKAPKLRSTAGAHYGSAQHPIARSNYLNTQLHWWWNVASQSQDTWHFSSKLIGCRVTWTIQMTISVTCKFHHQRESQKLRSIRGSRWPWLATEFLSRYQPELEAELCCDCWPTWSRVACWAPPWNRPAFHWLPRSSVVEWPAVRMDALHLSEHQQVLFRQVTTVCLHLVTTQSQPSVVKSSAASLSINKTHEIGWLLIETLFWFDMWRRSLWKIAVITDCPTRRKWISWNGWSVSHHVTHSNGFCHAKRNCVITARNFDLKQADKMLREVSFL